MALTVRIKGEKRLLEFTAPPDMKGTKVLMLSPTELFVYLPAFGKVRRIAGSISQQGFMGMTFALDDFQTKYGDLYTATIVPGSDGPAEVKLVAVARPERQPLYPKLEITVAKDRNVPTLIKYFNAAGINVKTETRTSTCQASTCAPSDQTMVDHTQGGASTRMARKAWKLNDAMSDDLFSKRNLDK